MIQKGQVPLKLTAVSPNRAGYAALGDATWGEMMGILDQAFQRAVEVRQSVAKLQFLQGGLTWPLYETIMMKPKLQ